MELPSMVQRSGDTLIVRSVVSGNQLYMDQNSTAPGAANPGGSNGTGGVAPGQTLSSSMILEQQIEHLKRAQHLMQQQQQQQQHHQQQQQQQHQQQTAAMELKEEGLPQCKIKRNYSCSYCTYFTQNPRYHLTHLRDVHGEKIVINKCKLCLYASRHYQKLVRHMKMVHGCTDGIAGSHGQARGKRGMNREARKRKMEENMSSPQGIKLINMDAFHAEQLQVDMEREHQKIQRDLDMFKKHHEEQQKSQQQQQQQQQQLSVSAAGALFAAAYEQQLRAQQREFDRESLKNDHSKYDLPESSPHQPLPESSPQQKPYDFTPTHATNNIEIPPQRPSFELTPSPSGSNSSPPPGQTNSGSTTPLGGLPSDEPSNNRLMKCSLCDFTTLYRNNLLEHEIEDHCNAKFYRCEKCSYVTHIKARFSKHVKYHSMPMIKCCTCDFRTPYKWNLDRHMKNHGGAGPFKCAACDFTADIKQSLTVHEMNHHVPPVGHAAGMTLARRRNKVGATDLSEDFFSDSAEMMEDHFNNNNMDEYDEMLMTAGPAEGVYDSKRLRYEEDEPTDLSQKGGSSDTSSVHNHTLPKAKKPLPNLIPISKDGDSILNLTTDIAGPRSSLSDLASMFFNEKQISEMLHPADKPEATPAAASQLSPTTTITSSASSRSLLARKGGSFFDKIKSSSATNENLICPCGHMAKCLSESIIHRKSCTFSTLSGNDEMDLDDEDHDEDGEEGRLEIDFNEDDECDKQSHSALNLSVTGSTRCQHCRHRCKSSVDLLNHLKICSEANSRCDSLSGESCGGSRMMAGDQAAGDLQHPMENRVFVWNKIPRNQQQEGSQNFDMSRPQQQSRTNSSSTAGGSLLSANNDENSYYGVETAPGYGEVTKKMTPEEEAANSSLKKVYKCPHCSFWASTASRFHVHIVGHLNKKPFECSLCSYRSNWRWDITKHIRLKTIRDPSHKNARVLMNDETGRRNYTKYNKYITLMKVTEEDGDPKLMKSGEMTPNQVASLAFINDYNQKQQGSITSSSSTPVNNILNGVREDITLEPIPPKTSAATMAGDDSLSDNFIRLPLLASMMNAAMAQQQHHKNQQNDHENATLITPSVTISAVKKSPQTTGANFKPSDEIILEMRQDGNEKNYKCRKCNFRHINRDAVLAHVKVHFPDPNTPIVTATATTVPKSAQMSSAHNSSSLQVSVNSNNYMNKVLAAMCMSQQQQQPNSNAANTQLSNLVAAGLSANSPLSGLALALAGKNPLKASQLNAAANILEHGEQKASLNEQASADNTTTSPNQLTVKALQQHQQTQATSSISGYGSSKHPSSSSLQNLLTSPRGGTAYAPPQSSSNNEGVLSGGDTTRLVMGSPKTNHTNKSGLMAAAMATAAPTTIVTTTTTPPTPSASHASLLHPTQTPSFPSSSNNNDNNICGDGLMILNDEGNGGGVDGVGCGGVMQNLLVVMGGGPVTSSSDHNAAIATSLSLSNQNQSQNSVQNHSSSNSNSNNNSNNNNSNSNNLGNFSGNGSNNNNNNNNNNGGNGSNNNNSLLTHDTTTGDRRDPSPYRCGHCHQVSNWKHVIQRHCRLKHAGVINIETLDRTATGDRQLAPIYKPLVNGAMNDQQQQQLNNNIISNSGSNSQYNLTLKALQQQQQQQQQQLQNNNSVLTDNNLSQQSKMSIALPKSETPHSLLHSPLTASAAAAANAANTPQDLQAAAVAYLAAAYKAAAAQSGNSGNPAAALANLPNLTSMAEELLLQQQLQKNDQIEITRVSSTNQNNNLITALNAQTSSSNSNLAQLLEANLQVNNVPVPTTTHQNNKSKQQKCPLCTYICESKSQMNYHISLHKPTQYECHLCTFVCAKKQHLSSHMRTVHQMLPNQANMGISAGSLAQQQANMDFSIALKMAAAAQSKQDSALAIDLSGIKANLPSVSSPALRLSASQQHHQSQLPPEYQYRLIYYCNKCPARYAQKHNDPQTAKVDLDDHLRQHEALPPNSSDEVRKYQCEYCDYRAPHETLIQTHRYVHTSQYQEKCNELYKNCKDDTVFRAPKLMHITATRKSQQPETIWVVDNELNEGQTAALKHDQNSAITSSCQGNAYESGNSLLKKQLESKQSNSTPAEDTNKNVTMPNQNQSQPDAEDSNTNSTAASVTASEMAAVAHREQLVTARETQENDDDESAAEKERCRHCPFESSTASEFKAHLQQHISVSLKKLAFTCEHCDFTAEEQQEIDAHTRIHFNSMEKLKDVAFFTSYDKLELSMEQRSEPKDDVNPETNRNEVNIKQELTARTDVDRVNENFKSSPQNEDESASATAAAAEDKQPKCAKIILYKNDGCLTIKKENNEPSQQQTQQPNTTPTTNSNSNISTATANASASQNISDRLRRRISRQGGAAGSTSSSTAAGGGATTNPDDQQSTSHKTILVNAKTGQVISRN